MGKYPFPAVAYKSYLECILQELKGQLAYAVMKRYTTEDIQYDIDTVKNKLKYFDKEAYWFTMLDICYALKNGYIFRGGSQFKDEDLRRAEVLLDNPVGIYKEIYDEFVSSDLYTSIKIVERYDGKTELKFAVETV